jgi:DNA-directed RNA polymerase subunit F
MADKRVVREEPITLAEVKVILSARRDAGDLLYEQSIALDHANKFARLSVEAAEALVKELIEAGLSQELAYKLTDLFPQSKQEIRMLFSKERFSSDETTLNTVISIIEKYGES